MFSECMEKGPYSTVRASDVARFMCSPFSLWCDRFADRSEQDPPDPILDELARRGNAHESMVLDGEQPGAVRVEPESKPEEIGGMNVQIDGNSNEESFLLGIEAMMGGAKTISKAMLFCLPDGMVGIPDILRRTSGRSAFGQHHYTVVEIKSARNHNARAQTPSGVLRRTDRQDTRPDAGNVPDDQRERRMRRAHV